jgi:hypothetical protein
MNKVLSAFVSVCIFILTQESAHSIKYKVDLNSEEGFIAFPHFTHAPYPSNADSTDQSKKISGTVRIKDQEYTTRFFSGWFFLDFNEDNIETAPSIQNALLDFYKDQNGHVPEMLQPLAQASIALRKKAEEELLSNPYAGRSLISGYAIGGGIPWGELTPTLTKFKPEELHNFLESLATVYGGTLTKQEFVHGKYFLGVSGVYMFGSDRVSGMLHTGNFRYTDDGKTANKKFELRCFPSQFEVFSLEMNQLRNLNEHDKKTLSYRKTSIEKAK